MAGRRAVFYCSASFNIDPKYNAAARDYVRAACSRGYEISSGGTIKGTMKVVVDATLECGGRAVGIIPRFMAQYVHPALNEVVWTESMSDRKVKMREGTALAVALPGGVGTLDEFFETLTLAKLGLYGGKVIVVNHEGFYDRLRDLLDFYVETGMLDPVSRSLAIFVSSVEEFEKVI